MLKRLFINNYVIIDKIEIDFSKSLNVIIGETGSGKSILIEALLLLFGEKASHELVRLGENKAIIEANFFFEENSALFEKLQEIEIEAESNEIILRREIPAKGNSRCFINDNPVTLSLLKYFSKFIVDFHGQNEQQKILEKENQLQIIDNLLENRGVIINYRKSFREISELIKKFNDCIERKNNNEEREAKVASILKEIDEINPIFDEDNIIDAELKLLENAEFLVSISDKFISGIDNSENSFGENSAISCLLEANKTLLELAKIDNSFVQYNKEFGEAIISINETLNFIKSYKNRIEFNPERIEELRNRYAILRKLTKKYGTVKEILQLKEDLQNEQNQIDNFEQIIEELSLKIEEKRDELTISANELTNARKKTSKIIEEKIVAELTNLGIENSIFEIRFSNVLYLEKKEIGDKKNDDIAKIDNVIKVDDVVKIDEKYSLIKQPTIFLDDKQIKVTEKGADVVEFYISTNKGEAVSSLTTAASGGEISRIMLAIKTIMADSDETPLLIFDEIDTGVSGRIAQKVGISIKNLAKYHQIIAITHLPQIAAMGESIVLISKNETADRVITSAKVLNEKEKIIEVAKMLSGETLMDSAIESAKELMKF